MNWMMKYIMVEMNAAGPSPILFPGTLKHVHMAHDIGFPVRSAGWVQVNKDGTVVTYGSAMSLDKAPHPEDAATIERWLREV